MNPGEFINIWMNAYNDENKNIPLFVSEEFGVNVAAVLRKAKILVDSGVILPGYNVDNTIEPDDDDDDDYIDEFDEEIDDIE